MNGLRLLSYVILGNFLLITGSLIGCFVTKAPACTGERISEELALITTQAFALYLSEK